MKLFKRKERNVLNVRFICTQGAEDLYKCVETGKVYVRQVCDELYVRWLTTSKWSGGYEASCPLREGIQINILDAEGQYLFIETPFKVHGYGDTVALKRGPFFSEEIKRIAHECAQEYSLMPYEAWKRWLMDKAPAAHKDYADNWLYCNVTKGNFMQVKKFNALGKTIALTKEFYNHQLTDAQWQCYELTLDKDTIELVGFTYTYKTEK